MDEAIRITTESLQFYRELHERAGRARFGDRPFLIPYYGSQRQSGAVLSIDEPVWCIPTRDRYALARGDRMRMLDVSELLSIQGFPRGYVLRGDRKDQVKQIGNATAVSVAAWNFGHLTRALA